MSLNPFKRRAVKVFSVVLPAFLLLAFPFIGKAGTSPDASKEAHAKAVQPLPAMGKLIVAGPEMKDPRFIGAIILLLDHSERGSAGLIINRPTGARLGAELPDIKGFKERRDPIFYGGPNRTDRAMALLYSKKAPPRSMKIFEDVYIGAGKGFFDGLMDNLVPEDVFRVYSGYVKWEVHELDGQVAAGLWTVMEARPGIVFAREPKALWHKLAR